MGVVVLEESVALVELRFVATWPVGVFLELRAWASVVVKDV